MIVPLDIYFGRFIQKCSTMVSQIPSSVLSLIPSPMLSQIQSPMFPKFYHLWCLKFRHQCCPKFHHQCCLILRLTMRNTCTCIKISENSQNTMFQRGFEPGDPKGRPHLPHGGLHIPHLSHWELYIPHLSHGELSKPHVSTYRGWTHLSPGGLS